jgi:crotonobetainyl-CoA:carnitine CoA-transferase CaiB-like acyl-CoA transferase
VAISASATNIAPRLFRAMGREDMVSDPKYSTQQARLANGDELDRIVADWIIKFTQKDVLKILEEYEVAAGPVCDIEQIIHDPHVRAREMVIEFSDEDLGYVRIPNIAPRFSRTPGKIRFTGRAPVGYDTVDILEDLGFSEEDINRLREKKAIGFPDQDHADGPMRRNAQ